jgi:hypothetical protein
MPGEEKRRERRRRPVPDTGLPVLPRPTARPQGEFQAHPLGRTLPPTHRSVRPVPHRAGTHLLHRGGRLRRVHPCRPVVRQRQRPGVQRERRGGEGLTPAPQATPPPVFGPLDQPGPQRVPLHVAQHRTRKKSCVPFSFPRKKSCVPFSFPLFFSTTFPAPASLDSMQASKGEVKGDDPLFLRSCHKASALPNKRQQKSRGREGGRCR